MRVGFSDYPNPKLVVHVGASVSNFAGFRVIKLCPLELRPKSRAYNLPLCVTGSLGAPDGVRNACGHCVNACFDESRKADLCRLVRTLYRSGMLYREDSLNKFN